MKHTVPSAAGRTTARLATTWLVPKLSVETPVHGPHGKAVM